MRVVEGGARRQDSVANAFAAIPADTDVVVIHDAARPFVDRATIERTIEAAARAGAAIAALPARDTVKLADITETGWVGGEFGEPLPAVQPKSVPAVKKTLPRETIFLAQTPQAFRRDVLARAIAHGQQGADATDEASLAEQLGQTVLLVPGDAAQPQDHDRGGSRVRARSARSSGERGELNVSRRESATTRTARSTAVR